MKLSAAPAKIIMNYFIPPYFIQICVLIQDFLFLLCRMKIFLTRSEFFIGIICELHPTEIEILLFF